MAGPALVDKSGNSKLIEILSNWGINLYAGVNGGGVIHVAKHLEPFESLHQANDGVPRLFDIPEAIGGSIPVGYHVATGKMAAAISTTGGATWYGGIGAANAKAHDIPAAYIFALNSTEVVDRGPLQNMTASGMNSLAMIRGMFGKNCLVIDDFGGLEKILIKGQEVLHKSQPVAFVFYPNLLSKEVNGFEVPWTTKPRQVNQEDASMFLREFPEEIRGRRVVIYVGEEAARYKGIQELTTSLATLLRAPIVYSLNSSSAVAHNNPYAAGHIHLGFNDWTKQLWDSLSEKDIVLFLGFDPGEYEMNLGKIKADVWHFTNYTKPYDSRNNTYQHRVDGKYRQVRGDIALALEQLIPKLEKRVINRPKFFEIPADLNMREIEEPVPRYVDLVKFYKLYARLVQEGTFIVNDVCQGYKDMQYVIQRPIKGVMRFDPHRISTMGDSFGVGIGAKIGNSNLRPHIHVGDGGFKYFEGALVNAQNLGLTVWVIDNGGYHIVGKGLETVIPKVDRRRYHSDFPRSVDFVGVAKKHGWDAYRLDPKLAKMEEIIARSYSGSTRSMLVHMRVDRNIEIGQNPRLLGLRNQGVRNYL